MKVLRQFLIILIISLLGEILNWILPLPIPASVYGLVLMLAALMTGVIQVPQVKEAAVILIELMPVMFIPAAVGLMSAWDKLRPIVVPVVLITFFTTLLVMGVTGIVTEKVIEKTEKGSTGAGQNDAGGSEDPPGPEPRQGGNL